MNNDERILKQEDVGRCWVSTVRLPEGYEGMNLGNYETMIKFRGEWMDYQERYDTKEEAEIGHIKAVAYANGINTGVFLEKTGFDSEGSHHE